RHRRDGSGGLHHFYRQALLTKESRLRSNVGYGMRYNSGCIADANFFFFELSLGARANGKEEQNKERTADAHFHKRRSFGGPQSVDQLLRNISITNIACDRCRLELHPDSRREIPVLCD